MGSLITPRTQSDGEWVEADMTGVFDPMDHDGRLAMLRFGINCDCGESYGRLSVGHDERVVPLVTSANIACGFHGGDPTTIRRTARLAKQHGVACGAPVLSSVFGSPDLPSASSRSSAATSAAS